MYNIIGLEPSPFHANHGKALKKVQQFNTILLSKSQAQNILYSHP